MFSQGHKAKCSCTFRTVKKYTPQSCHYQKYSAMALTVKLFDTPHHIFNESIHKSAVVSLASRVATCAVRDSRAEFGYQSQPCLTHSSISSGAVTQQSSSGMSME